MGDQTEFKGYARVEVMGHQSATPKLTMPAPELTPMSELDAMLARGWGETPREKIPADWRERFGPDKRRRL